MKKNIYIILILFLSFPCFLQAYASSSSLVYAEDKISHTKDTVSSLEKAQANNKEGDSDEVAQADKAYNEGNYAEAIVLYEEIIKNRGVSAALLYNLGNAYVKENDYGNAMLCYQRAKKLDPSNKEINNNISYLSGKVEDANKAEQGGKRKKVSEDTPNFFQSVHASIAKNTSSNTWAGFAAGAFILFSAGVCLYLFSTKVIVRKTGFFGGILLLAASLICMLCSFLAAAEFENQDYGVVMGYKVSLQTEPNSSVSKDSNEGVLTHGTKVRIISEETDANGIVNWYKIRLNSDYIGWVKAEDIAII